MSKNNVKKVTGVKRAPLPVIATSIIGITPKKTKKETPDGSAAAPVVPPAVSLEQFVQTEILSAGTLTTTSGATAAAPAEISSLRERLLGNAVSTEARAKYEEFVRSLDFSTQPGRFETVTFGDILHVVPAIKANKRKFSDLYQVDQNVAKVYADAQLAYKTLEEKAEALKITDYAKQKKALKIKAKEKATVTASATVAETVATAETTATSVAVETTAAAAVPAAETTSTDTTQSVQSVQPENATAAVVVE